MLLAERFYYFVHGIVTMYFVMTGIRYYINRSKTRFDRLTAYVMLYWAFLLLKDLVFYPSPDIRNNYLSNLVVLADMTAIPAGCFFVIELLDEGWYNLRRAILLIGPFILFTLLYAITGSDIVFDAMFIFVWAYSGGFAIHMFRILRRYRRRLADNYSNIEFVPVRWLKGVAFMLVACLTAWTLSCYFTSWVSDTVYLICLALMWFVALQFASHRQIPPPY